MGHRTEVNPHHLFIFEGDRPERFDLGTVDVTPLSIVERVGSNLIQAFVSAQVVELGFGQIRHGQSQLLVHLDQGRIARRSVSDHMAANGEIDVTGKVTLVPTANLADEGRAQLGTLPVQLDMDGAMPQGHQVTTFVWAQV